MKFFFSIFLIILSLNCSSQEGVPLYGLISDEEIFIGTSQKQLAKKKVAEIYITEVVDSSELLWRGKNPIFDTIFYGIKKDGTLKYWLSLIIDTWPPSDSNYHINDNGWRGYDTTYIKQHVKQGNICNYINFSFYDSIGYSKKREIEYMRWSQGTDNKYTKNVFNEKGQLIEQYVNNGMPDGGRYYKAFYVYDKNNMLVEIGYGNIGNSVKSLSGNNSNDFDFPITEKKRINYRSDGQIEFITCYKIETSSGNFFAAYSNFYSYNNGLVSKITTKDSVTSQVYAQNIGYKFYKK